MQNTISFNTKFGWITVTEVNKKITKIQFNKTKKRGIFSQNLKRFRKDLTSYLQGKTSKLEASIQTAGNSMEKKVWNELKKIKKGKIKSYGEIAKKLKISPRYVGRVCGKNKHILVIPCHRVIRSDGSIGGFSSSGGINLKKKLLEFEMN